METIRGKVTVNALKQMQPGKSVVFILDQVRDIYSAKTLAYQQQAMLGCKFSTSTDIDNKTITITKNEI